MRVLIVDQENLGLDLALRAAAYDHDVQWYRHRPKRPERNGEGFRGFRIIDDWRAAMPWVGKDGIVILTGNCAFLRELDRFREFGYRIFGPTERSAELEIKRGAGMKAMEAAGLKIAPYHEFSSLEEAEKFARKSSDCYVFKPMGDTEDKSSTYVSSSPADMVGWIQRKIARGMNIKGKCMLQERIEMVGEISMSGWFGPDGFLPKYQHCFEFKRLMPGDVGPNCFTPDAEVLTSTGWKFWPDVTMDHEICTLKDGEIQYEKPSQIVVGDFKGNLIGWESPMIDVLVTPGHNMYVQDDHYRKPFWFEPAHEVVNYSRTVMRGGGKWLGEDIQLPSCARSSAAEWAALVGIYIADGSTKSGSLVFGNCPTHKQQEFSAIARAAGFVAVMYGPDLYINDKYLAEYFGQFGVSENKFVPDHIKRASPDVVAAFLRGYGAGDGSRRKGNLTYTTASPQLADDLQELALKAGMCAGIRMRDRRDESHMVKGYECINRLVAYDIGVSEKRYRAEISPDISYLKPYDGKVYCVTVSSHVIYVRRNGKPMWIGQTGEMGSVTKYVEKDRLVNDALVPMTNALKITGHIGDFDISGGVNSAGEFLPFEFTMRLGWPAFYIQTASHKGDPVKWMSDLMNGHDTLKVSEDVAIGIVMAAPRFPYDKSPADLIEKNPISGIEENIDDVHMAYVMRGKGPVMKDGKVVDSTIYQTAGEYVLVATGLGATVEKARKKVYKTVDEIKFADRIYRNDIGCSLEKSLPKLQKFGYCSGVSFS